MNFLKNRTFLVLISTISLFSACSDDEKTLEIPNVYDSTSFEANSATERAVLNQFGSLVSAFTSARNSSITLDFNTTLELYDVGSPAIADVTSFYYDSKIVGNDGWLMELTKASGKTYQPGTPTGDGGVFGNYLFDENGLELQQVIEKGMYASTHYKHFLTLSKTIVDEKAVDGMVTIFGASPAFPNSNASKHETPDRYSAIYVARRDKNDGNGFYTTIRDQFIRLQAAAKQGNAFTDDKSEAIQLIKENWEKGIMATVINYLYSSISNLSATNPTDAQKSSALHSYGEAVGFVHGWRGIEQTDRIISDAQIDAILTLLNAPQNGTATSYLFVTDAVNELPKLQQADRKSVV